MTFSAFLEATCLCSYLFILSFLDLRDILPQQEGDKLTIYEGNPYF